MSELLRCPFCGFKLEQHIDTRAFRFVGIGHDLVCGTIVFFHPYVDCVLDGFQFNENEAEKWNRRYVNESEIQA